MDKGKSQFIQISTCWTLRATAKPQITFPHRHAVLSKQRILSTVWNKKTSHINTVYLITWWHPAVVLFTLGYSNSVYLPLSERMAEFGALGSTQLS